MLIATLSTITQEDIFREIISNPHISAVRYNTGYVSPYDPRETLERIKEIADGYGKELWIDLKGRQLRITHWAAPNYGKIILNHEFDVDLPAKVFFRGEDQSNLSMMKGKVIYVNPSPRNVVGQGQAINIVGKNLQVKNYSTKDDFRYIAAGCELGIFNYMLSFVEKIEDIAEVENFIKTQPSYEDNQDRVKLCLKIESLPGLDLVEKLDEETLRRCTLMAARDDMMINIGDNKARMIKAMELIIKRDAGAIAASRIFSSLENQEIVSMGDISDVYLLRLMGYKNFMLSDTVCLLHFRQAIKAWEDCQEAFGEL
jgi:pyruvate kinase